jgi:hypothetical protein
MPLISLIPKRNAPWFLTGRYKPHPRGALYAVSASPLLWDIACKINFKLSLNLTHPWQGKLQLDL